MDCTQALSNSEDEDSRLTKEFGFLVLDKIRYPLREGSNTIGRDEDRCEVAFRSETLSRQHAVIKVINNVAYLMDLRSINKTKIGCKVLAPYEQYRLNHGDEIYFADLPAKFEIGQANEEIPETPKAMRSVQKVIVLESPDLDKSKDASFILSSQQPTEFQKKPIPLTSCPKDSVFWNASADSPSLKFDRDDTVGSIRKEVKKTVVHGDLTVPEENGTTSNDSLEVAMNESYNIYEASTQFGPSINNAETQAKTVHDLDTQLPVDNLSKGSCTIHEMETQLPISVSLNESTKVDTNIDKNKSIEDMTAGKETSKVIKDSDSDEEVIFEDFELQNADMFNSKVTITANTKIDSKSNYNVVMCPESQNLLEDFENLDKLVGNTSLINNNVSIKEKNHSLKINIGAPQIGDDDSTDCEDDLIELSQNNLVNSKSNKIILNDSDETDCEDDLVAVKENNQTNIRDIVKSCNVVAENISNKTINSTEFHSSLNTGIKVHKGKIDVFDVGTQIIEVPKFKIPINDIEISNLKKIDENTFKQTKVFHDSKDVMSPQNKNQLPIDDYSEQTNSNIDEDDISTQIIKPATNHISTLNSEKAHITTLTDSEDKTLLPTQIIETEDNQKSALNNINKSEIINPAYQSTQDLLNDLDSQHQEVNANDLTQIIQIPIHSTSPVKKFNNNSIFKMPTPMSMNKKSIGINAQSDLELDIPSPVRVFINNKPHYETAEDIMHDLLTQPLTDNIEKPINNSEVESQDPDLTLLSMLKEPPGFTRKSLMSFSKVLQIEQDDSISDQATQIIHENQIESIEDSDLIRSSQENDDSLPLEHFPHLSKGRQVHRTLSDEQLTVVQNIDTTTPTKSKAFTYSQCADSCSESSIGDIFSPIKYTNLKTSVLDMELPNSQEIKNAIKSSHSSIVVLESISNSESDNSESENTSTPIVFRKRIPLKKVLNTSPIRQSNRSRKLTRKVLDSHDTHSFQLKIPTKTFKENNISAKTKTTTIRDSKSKSNKKQTLTPIDNCPDSEIKDKTANSYKSQNSYGSKTSPRNTNMNNPVNIEIDKITKPKDKKKPDKPLNKEKVINSETRSKRNTRSSQSGIANEVKLQKSPSNEYGKTSNHSDKVTEFSIVKNTNENDKFKKKRLSERNSQPQIAVQVKLLKLPLTEHVKTNNRSNTGTENHNLKQKTLTKRNSQSEITLEVKLQKSAPNENRNNINRSNKESKFSKGTPIEKDTAVEISPIKMRTRSDNNIKIQISTAKHEAEQSTDLSNELGSRSRSRKRRSKSSENTNKSNVKKHKKESSSHYNSKNITLKKNLSSPSKNQSVVYGNSSDSLSSGTNSDSDNRSRRSSSRSTVTCSPDAKKLRSSDVSKERCSVMFTGLKDPSLEKIVHKLGGIVVSDPAKCSVLVTERIKRTLKFLLVLGLRKPIVGFNWLYACQTTNTILDPWLYTLTDGEAEKKFSFSLDKTLKTPSKWLNRVHVTATPSVQPPPVELKLIVEYSGGTYVDLESITTKISSKSSARKQDLLICISCPLPSDKQFWPAVLDAGYKIVTSEVILTGVLRNKMDWKQYCLTK